MSRTAKAPPSPADEHIVGQFITFRIAGRTFAIGAACVRGLLPVHEITFLDLPAPVCAIASIRGHDFPVVDLRRKLGVAAGVHGRRPCIVAVEARPGHLAGFIADRISELLELPTADIRADRVRIDGRWRRLLDGDDILSEPEMEEFLRLAARQN